LSGKVIAAIFFTNFHRNAGGKQPRQKNMLRFFRSDTPSQYSDEELLARYQAGGEARYLGQLYERYMPMVYGVCVKILRDPGKAEDAVMNIYEELTRKAKEHQVESFRGWLYVLARNHCLMEWRKKQRRPKHQHHKRQPIRQVSIRVSSPSCTGPIKNAPGHY
jgi:hypothetical protein